MMRNNLDLPDKSGAQTALPPLFGSAFPLVPLRRYGFKLTYQQRKWMKFLRDEFGDIPIEVDEEDEAVCMAHAFTADDRQQWVSRTWVFADASTWSYSEMIPQNVERRHPTSDENQ